MRKYSFSKHWIFFLSVMRGTFSGKVGVGGRPLNKIEKKLRLFYYLSISLLLILFVLSILTAQAIVDPLIGYIFTFSSGVMLITLGIYGFIHNKGIWFYGGGLDFDSGFPAVLGQFIYLLMGIGLIWIFFEFQIPLLRTLIPTP